MSQWSPTAIFIAQYAVAAAAALCSLLLSTQTLTARSVIGKTGLYGIIGGSFAPVATAIVPGLLSVKENARLLFWAAMIGGGFVSIPELKKFVLRFLNASAKDDEGNH